MQHLEEWRQPVFDDAEELGLSAVVAERYRPDAFEAEPTFQAMVAGCSRLVLKPAFAALDGHGPTLTVGDKSYHQVDVTVGDAMALFGCASLRAHLVITPSKLGISIRSFCLFLGYCCDV
ncbi:MAG: hypothetical protein OXE94_08015 [Aestuariivita sp.]|nr:hypothetical protein [Aestuariivita sp.]MCY4204036.1 hypothetical protein [Aestuariivita sp.]